jgi:NAD(P)-dependent dehydrogenase (short-subunit alcohol dehydrogenase family)
MLGMSENHSSFPSLAGKVALVMGASRGIGAEVARAYAAAGAAVVLAARDDEALASVASEIEGAGGSAIAIRTDVTVEDDVRRAVDLGVREYGRLDVACNNAAGGPMPAPLADLAVEAFAGGIDTNVMGSFLCLKHEIRAILATAGGGAIVNMGSTASLEAVGGLAAYVASKHALAGLTKVAALDYAEQGIRVNLVAPGPILTYRLQQAPDEYRRAAADAIPVRRLVLPHEVARAVVWLCSEQASFVTGTTLTVDGGKLAGVPPFQTRPSLIKQETS